MVGALKGKPWIFAVAALTALLLLYLIGGSENAYVPSLSSIRKSPNSLPTYPAVCEQPLNGTAWDFVSERDERNLGLTDEQCQVCLVHPGSARALLT